MIGLLKNSKECVFILKVHAQAQAAYPFGHRPGQLGPELFPGIGVLPGPATGSHIENRGAPVAPLRQPQLNVPETESHQWVCVFITAVPITKLFARGGGWRVEDMCYELLRAEASVN
jgi:hypothetical protein